LREQLEGSLTCGEAEFAISRQLDGRLSRHEKGQLRAHLRECSECAHFARRQRAQRSALKSLGLIPVPSSLASLFGGGSAGVGTGVALKSAAVVVAGAVIGGGGYEAVRHAPWHEPQPAAARPTHHHAVPTKAAVAGASAVAREPTRLAVAFAKATIARERVTKAHKRPKTRAHARNAARLAQAKVVSARPVRGAKRHAFGRGHAKNERAVTASRAAGRLKVQIVRSHQAAQPARSRGGRVAPSKVPKQAKPEKPSKRAKDVPKPVTAVPNVPGPPSDKKTK
jgi:hypothetical protein